MFILMSWLLLQKGTTKDKGMQRRAFWASCFWEGKVQKALAFSQVVANVLLLEGLEFRKPTL